MATTVGEIQYKVSIDTSSLRSQMSNVKNEIAGTSSSGITSGNKLSKGWAAATGAIAGVASAAFSKVTSVISNSIDGAIKRIDTLNNSKIVFKAMGYSVDDVNRSMDDLDTYLQGLPTSLDSAVKNVQSLSASFGGINNGTRYFKAMNNAGLAFGATAEQIEGAITQLGQLSLDGPLDAATWNSLRNNGFGPVFSAMAAQANMTVGELKESFGGQGDQTVQDFLNKLVELDEKGGGAMESLSSLARKNTQGIQTSIENAKTAVVRGVASIISALGASELNQTIDGLGKLFESVFSGKNIEKNATNLANGITGMINNLISNIPQWISNLSQVFVQLVNAIVPKLPELVQSLVNGLTSPQNLQMIIQAFLNLMLASVQAFPQIITALLDALPTLIDNIVAFLSDPANAIMIVTAFVKMLGALVQVPFKVIPRLIVAIGNLMSVIPRVIWGWVQRVADAMGGNVKAAVDKVREFIGRIKQAGGDLINGLLNGIKEKKDAVINWIKKICSGALDAVKKFFGIASPSKVMAQMGNYMMQGLENGIASAGAGVVSEAQRVNEAVANAFGVDDMAINPTVGAGSFSSNTIGSSSDTSGRFGSVVVNQNVVANTPVDMQIINQRLGNAVRRATA